MNNLLCCSEHTQFGFGSSYPVPNPCPAVIQGWAGKAGPWGQAGHSLGLCALSVPPSLSKAKRSRNWEERHLDQVVASAYPLL